MKLQRDEGEVRGVGGGRRQIKMECPVLFSASPTFYFAPPPLIKRIKLISISSATLFHKKQHDFKTTGKWAFVRSTLVLNSLSH